MTGRRPRVTGVVRALLLRLVATEYPAGRTLDEIANTYGASPSTVYRLALEAGCAMRPRGPRRPPDSRCATSNEVAQGV